MRRGALNLAGLLVAVLAPLCALAPDVARAGEPLLRMTDVRVSGGEAAWHASPSFRVDWTQEPSRATAKPRAVVYQLYYPPGHPLGSPVRDTEEGYALESIQVPSVPGIYTAEIWLENREGQPGPPATVTLRFDDVAPAPATPQAPAGWVSGGKPVRVKVGHPAAPLPLSGIRGYAVAVDRGDLVPPCAAIVRCSSEETDFAGGIADDSLSLGVLPEGINFVRVVAVSGSGVSSPIESAEVRVDATPPLTTLEDPPLGWSNKPLRITAVAADALSGMDPSQGGDPFTAIAVDGNIPTRAGGDRASARVSGSGIHQLSLYGRDVAGNIADGQAGAPAPKQATVKIDEEPPAVAFAARQDPSEPERIEAKVTDALSGPSGQHGSIAVRPLGSGARFEELPTSVEPGRLVARWGSDSYPPGNYEFRAIGYDLAGNAASGTLRSDGAKMVLPSPLKTPATLSAGFGDKPRAWQAKKRVPYGRGVRYSGRLQTAAGAPIGGAEVTVTETFAAGSVLRSRATTVRTETDGAFSLRLAPGPSRQVATSFGGSRTLARTAGAGALLTVGSAVRLHASTALARVGGAPVVFSGRLAHLGAKAPAGKSVELQFRYPGADWSEFRTVKAGAGGRFRYPYRFSDDDSRGVRFQFRAVVPAQESWPYDTGASRPVIVTGR
ncbi:MAG: carboxypeptidase-like regulatory domain-containing protein [Solirubrobacterales bacterium]